MTCRLVVNPSQYTSVRSGISFGKIAVARSCAVACLVLFFARQLARADFSMPGMLSASSASGQFLVTSSQEISPLSLMPEIATNDNFVRLEPALLAVSADRVRNSLMQKLGLDSHAPWSGKIYLALHPARSLDEDVAIFPSRFENTWVYHVVLPDVLPRDRLVRALTGVLLLEYANRNAGDHSADVPSWLVEGFSWELLAENLQQDIISAPDQTINSIPITLVNQYKDDMDHLAAARDVLQNYTVLTFSQLSWPTDMQLSSEDGGQYHASAQLFVDELLALHNGGAKMRAMLELLPRYYNWQTAFESAFHENFRTPLDIEKWWALKTVIFSAQSPGPQWTIAASREKLDELLSVAVEFRSTSNSLPNYTAVSLQRVVQNFNPTLQRQILQTKLRDLELAELRVAPSLAVLTAEYRNALAGYLGETPVKRNGTVSREPLKPLSSSDTIRILDSLDAQRRSNILATRPGFLEQR